MKTKLIVTDLDKTLLRGDCTLSDYTVEVFRQCRERGILTAFASARAESAMTRFTDVILPDCIISNGGAMIRVRGEVICRNMLSGADVRRILDMRRTFTGGQGQITAHTADRYFCNAIPADPDRRAAAEYTDFSDFAEPVFKITMELGRHEWAEAIAAACPDCTLMHYTGEIWRCFSARGSDKGTALCRLAAHLRIEPESITAFGDDQNDLPMLEYAGTAVAVGNAIDAVKSAADFVTAANDEDGVARYIERFILR